MSENNENNELKEASKESKQEDKSPQDSKAQKVSLKLTIEKFFENNFYTVILTIFAVLLLFVLFQSIKENRDEKTSRAVAESSINVFYVDTERLEKEFLNITIGKIASKDSEVPDLSLYNDSVLHLDEVINEISLKQNALILKKSSLMSYEHLRDITDLVLEKYKNRLTELQEKSLKSNLKEPLK